VGSSQRIDRLAGVLGRSGFPIVGQAVRAPAAAQGRRGLVNTGIGSDRRPGECYHDRTMKKWLIDFMQTLLLNGLMYKLPKPFEAPEDVNAEIISRSSEPLI
jgi:hypothetical protein